MISENTQILDNNVASKLTIDALIENLEKNKDKILQDGNYEQAFQEIYMKLTEWLDQADELKFKIEELEQQILDGQRRVTKEYISHSTKDGKEIETFNIFKFAAVIENQGEDIFGKKTGLFFLDGYKLVMAIREFFTGQPIVYTVGIAGKSGGQEVFYKRTLTAKDLFADTNAVSFTSNLYRTIPIADQTLEEGKLSLKIFTLKIKASQERYGITDDTKETAMMNNNLMRSLMQYRPKNLKDKKINNGVIFEVYENFTKRYDTLFNQSRKAYKYKEVISFDSETRALKDFPHVYNFRSSRFSGYFRSQLDSLYFDAVRNNLRFDKGGDLGVEQLKFNSAKLFNDVTTLMEAARRLQEGFEKKSLEGLKDTIVAEFTAGMEEDKYLSSEIDKIANEEAINGINDVFRQIGVR